MRCEDTSILRVVDASFLSHALLPHQRTATATLEFSRLQASGDRLALPESLLTEFLSLVRKSVTRGVMSLTAAEGIVALVLRLPIAILPTDETILRRAWELAARLGQSDVFDALGYAAAEAYDAEFWTSDGRFANAAQGAALSRLRHVS